MSGSNFIGSNLENVGKTSVFPVDYGRIGGILHGQIWPDWGL